MIYHKNFIKGKISYFLMAAAAIITVVLFAIPFIIIQAKYYLKSDIKTVVNSNGFYFSSNYLSEVSAGKDNSEYIMYGWDGKTVKSFAFRIRNYDNPLLFNNEDQKVSYHISYDIEEKYKDKVDVILYKLVGGVYEEDNLDDVLEGGEDNYSFYDYKLTVRPKPGVRITEDLSVLIKAETVEAPYDRVLSTKVTLQYTEYTKFISSKGFVNLDRDDYAFEYSVCTANAIDLSEMENSYVKTATKELHLYWDNEKLTLDRFDYIISDNFNTLYLNEGDLTEDNMKEYKNTVIIDKASNTGHIYFDALPFSSFNMYFYKKKGVKDMVWEGLSEESLVNVEVVDD